MIWQAELLGIQGIYHQDPAAAINLPYDVPANEFMNIEQEKFSKSRNWAVWLPDILERYQPDAVRYYVTRTMPETADSDFTWEGFFSCVNNELLAAWGNLVNRVAGFAYKRYDGRVPTPDALSASDEAILQKVNGGFEAVTRHLEAVRLREALGAAMALVRDVNAYLDERAPWKTIKQDEADAARSVYTTLCAIDNLNVLLAPFLPFSAQHVHELLGYDGQVFGDLKIVTYHETSRAHDALIYDGTAAQGTWQPRILPPGQPLREPKPLYIKLEPEVIEAERARLGEERVEKEIVC